MRIILLVVAIVVVAASIAPVFAQEAHNAFENNLCQQHWDNPFKERVLEGVQYDTVGKPCFQQENQEESRRRLEKPEIES